jgi:hypothetical protein
MLMNENNIPGFEEKTDVGNDCAVVELLAPQGLLANRLDSPDFFKNSLNWSSAALITGNIPVYLVSQELAECCKRSKS